MTLLPMRKGSELQRVKRTAVRIAEALAGVKLCSVRRSIRPAIGYQWRYPDSTTRHPLAHVRLRLPCTSMIPRNGTVALLALRRVNQSKVGFRVLYEAMQRRRLQVQHGRRGDLDRQPLWLTTLAGFQQFPFTQ